MYPFAFRSHNSTPLHRPPSLHPLPGRTNANMPTLSSLSRSLTLPLNRKRTNKPPTASTLTTPMLEITDPVSSLDPSPSTTTTTTPAIPATTTTSTIPTPVPVPTPLEFSASAPPALPRRQNSFLGIKTSALSTNGGIFNLNLDGLRNNGPKSPTLKSPTTAPKSPFARRSSTTNKSSDADGFVPPAYVAPDNAASGAGVVFGKPLKESLKYASVQISTANADGELYVWGYIPVVVAKCGLYLKENATEVPGTFRVNGSNRRMRELQAAFETPPRYGKNLDWKQETYTTHDVASVFRRYLTQMPEPVIPYDLYHQVSTPSYLRSISLRP
ncbi:hypothetical protein D9611_001481 [Ephemerocybe angulata]|uniref:Rho-GAP domain-containing protein n=1 Tax=Ephemerocybe angulata TaxID=980116 RepID=A0A8H5FMF6_9AGAR|nr:hypothetical protein D9611_001481 [Tulosesus angulatus]